MGAWQRHCVVLVERQYGDLSGRHAPGASPDAGSQLLDKHARTLYEEDSSGSAQDAEEIQREILAIGDLHHEQ